MTTRRSPEQNPSRRRFTRREALELGGATAISSTVLAGSLLPIGEAAADTAASTYSLEADRLEAVVDLLRPDIKPRSEWARELPVTGEIVAEEDVRFLLVHHTASTNSYEPDEVASQIRDFYKFHTGPEKGWPDVAYNFFVDRFGGIWEARAGSVDGPVRGDATGGSQGHALLCSLIGDHSKDDVTAEAKDAMVRLLAWLGARYGVDTTPGTSIVFESRGSNRWPAGAEVTARTISGHRDMSQTTCPGDFAYGWIDAELPAAVTGTIANAVTETATAVTIIPAEPEGTTTTTQTTVTTVTTAESVAEDAMPSELDSGDDELGGALPVVVGGIAVVSAAAIGLLVRFRSRATGG